MLVVTIVVARFVVRHFALPFVPSIRLGMGGIALVLLLLAEFSFGLWLRGLSICEYLAARDPVWNGVLPDARHICHHAARRSERINAEPFNSRCHTEANRLTLRTPKRDFDLDEFLTAEPSRVKSRGEHIDYFISHLSP